MHLTRYQLQAFWLQKHSRCVPILRDSTTRRCASLGARKYTTDRDTSHSPLLSQSLDLKQQSTRRHDTIGPFRLGLTQPSLQKQTAKKWSELSAGGKVMRTTARTTNFGVILLGAGLSAVLIYALTSELFSKNSPTVLYGEACDRIKASQQVAKYLHGTLSFHNNAPSTTRPRHRNRHVSSQIVVDPSGREHMLIRFFVSCKPGSTSSSETSYLDSLIQWTQSKAAVFSDLTLDESLAWTKYLASDMLESSKQLFKYLSGTPVPLSPIPPAPSLDSKVPQKEGVISWSFAGLFSGLRGLKGGPTVESLREAEGQVWTDGEVHADLIRNNDGYFVFRYLLVDIPNSRFRNHPLRVFVERTAGVRENESVMRWDS